VSILTNAVACQVAATGANVPGVWHGNNAALLCPACNGGAILVTARPNWRGSGPANPVNCPNGACNQPLHLVSPVGPGVPILIVGVA
jgi:hypothetical protein